MDKPTYLLMNKNTPVLEYYFAVDTNELIVTDVANIEYAPPLVDAKGVDPSDGLNTWWGHRGFPDSRIRAIEKAYGYDYDHPNQLKKAFDRLKIQSHALSLSDQYWIKPLDSSECWDAVNFFTNPFDERIGELLAGVGRHQKSQVKKELDFDLTSSNPDFSTDGELPKWWSIGEDGTRYLNKCGRPPASQEPINEVIATELYARLLGKDEFVSYSLSIKDNQIFSSCPNMITEHQELVTAWSLLKQNRLYPSTDTYKNLCDVYRASGVQEPELAFSKIIVCDFIMANTDRHLNNLGLIRNVETLEFCGPAPLFDSGNSLYCDLSIVESHCDVLWKSRPFDPQPEEQLKRAIQLDWLDVSRLSDFTDVIRDALANQLPATRLDEVIRQTERQIAQVERHQAAIA
jgi:hypothetical protein